MILGIGTDITEIARIRLAVERQGERFLEKILTENEIGYCKKFKDSFPRYAGRFAAKEAILKALGSDLAHIAWHDIEILNNADGKPAATFHGKLRERLMKKIVHLSISHCDTHAVASAIIEDS